MPHTIEMPLIEQKLKLKRKSIPRILTTEDDVKNAKDAETEKLVVVYMMAEWCLPCQKIDGEVKEIMSLEGLVFYQVDVDRYDRDFPVQLLPCFVLFKRGEKVDTIVGTRREMIFERIRKFL